jgi:hypothetical protein
MTPPCSQTGMWALELPDLNKTYALFFLHKNESYAQMIFLQRNVIVLWVFY